jgi:hypothetical protein
MKKCVKCQKSKTFENFHKQKASADGYKHWCKLCTKNYDKVYKTKNQKKIRQQQIEYRQKNREELNLCRKQWGINNPDKVAKNAKIHREKHKDKINQKRREKRKNNINFKLRTTISNRIRIALLRISKNSSAYELTGCSWEELKIYLEKQFVDGMSWENYGRWHIDHIKPCCSFDLTDIEQQKICFHYTNLQPLWAIDNLKKSGKYTSED